MLFVFLVTFGGLLLIEEGIRAWSSDLVTVARPPELSGAIDFGNNRLPIYNLTLLE